MTKIDKLINDLDLKDFIGSFYSFFSRPQGLTYSGFVLKLDILKELDKHHFTPPPLVKNLDEELIRLSKSFILNLSDIFEFIKILRYFAYLKKQKFKNNLYDMIVKIQIPDIIYEIDNYFFDDGSFKEDMDEGLRRIKSNIELNEDNINSKLHSILNLSKLSYYVVDKSIRYFDDTPCILIRGGFSKIIKGSVIGRSNNGFFYFLPRDIENYINNIRDLKQEKLDILYKYEKDFSKKLETIQGFLKFINRQFYIFDNYQARVFFARENDLSFIEAKKGDKIILKDFKHPAINNPKVLNIDFSTKVLLLTGVNAGGKTMLLKSILTASFLAKYLIPMSINSLSSYISYFKDISLIIDDFSNVKNDISTFAGRIIEFKKLFFKKDALVGIDEIEIGTDFEESASLFKVIIQSLVQNNIKMVITTHHKRLASLLATDENVCLCAALYDEKNRIPKYEFLQGIIGKSYAFETALRYGISKKIVKEAKEIYGEERQNLDELIEKGTSLQNSLINKNNALNKKLDDLEKLKNKFKEKLIDLSNKEELKIKELEFAYKEAIDKAKEAVKQRTVQEMHKKMTKAHLALPKIKRLKKSEDIIKKGDFVKYNNSRGQVLDINDNMAYVDLNNIRLKVELALLVKSFDLKPKLDKVEIKSESISKSNIKLDLHGLRRDEAIELLDKFISDSLVAGFDEVIVYHGIGAGILAAAVSSFLKDHPKVLSFCDAPPNLGGYGAKIINL